MANYRVFLPEKREISIEEEGSITVDGTQIRYSVLSLGNGVLRVSFNNNDIHLKVESLGANDFIVWIKARPIHLTLQNHRSLLLAEASHASQSVGGSSVIMAPMPGLVRKLEVGEGQQLEAGTGLLVLEAMKMENEIHCQVKCRVLRILVIEGQVVEKGEKLIELELQH